MSDGNDPVPRDFATTPVALPVALPLTSAQHVEGDDSRNRPSSHVHYALNIDTVAASTAPAPHSSSAPELAKPVLGRSDTEAAVLSPSSMRRRLTRAGTFRTVDDFEDFTVRPGWHRVSPSACRVSSLMLTSTISPQPAPSPVWTRPSPMAATPPCRR